MDKTQFENFLKTISAADLHIRSYNHFIAHELPLMVQNFTLQSTADRFKLEFYGVHVPRACALKNGVYHPISPYLCRRENMSYMTPIFASVKQTKFDATGSEIETTIMKKIVIAHIPVMLGSVLCHTTFSKKIRDLESTTDDGGYFIVNGVEHVLVTQRRKCYNFPQVLEANGVYSVNMRSISKETNHSVLIELSSAIDSESILCSLPYISKKIPLYILISAFGMSWRAFCTEFAIEDDREDLSQDEALEYIGSFATKKPQPLARADDEEVVPVSGRDESDDEEDELDEDDNESWDSESVKSTDTVTIAQKASISYARQIIDIEMFPHVGLGASLHTKYLTLCSMVRRLLMAKRGQIKADNRDNLMFHRFETSGILLAELYTMLFRNFLNSYKECTKSGSAITDFTNKLEAFVTKNIKSCIATGKWGIQKASYVRQGVSQVLARFSVLGTRSHLHRLMLPVGKEGKNVKVRLIHPSHVGFIDLFETPEGQGCGIVLNFTTAVQISKEYQAPYIRDIVVAHCSMFLSRDTSLDVDTSLDKVDVWIENTFVFQTSTPRELVTHMKDLRTRNVLPRHTCIYTCEDRKRRIYEIRVLAEKGRVLRPVLDREGQIVYLDPAEIQNNYVAMTREEFMSPNHGSETASYCELKPILLFSICAGCIPFLDHIQSPRIVYESSMMKQAIGFFATNYPIRYDTTAEVLDYSQKCLLSTSIGRAFGMHDAPAGVNCVVAIMTMGSWNAEDCVILNKAAIERGLFSSTTYKTLVVEEYRPKTNDARRFCIPNERIRKPVYNYGLLDENGIVRKGAKVSKKDVIVGCVREAVKKGKKKEVVEMDCSELSDEEGIVETVEVVKTFSGNRIVNIILKIRKIPERGDKFANLNAQKGTCGLILSPEDMPFCAEDGIIPDLLVNPNALPSRMTISMFLEFVLGQECCLDGTFRDATPFEKIEKIGNVLHDHGYDPMGWKTLIDGTTGKPLHAKIFMGVNYYQKLKHMVSNKINARNFGNVTISTRQPVSGRSKQGGIRAGEMEVQGWLSHGVGDFLREKLYDCSDYFTVFICNECQVISNHKDQCHLCQGELYETSLPYASKIVFQLLNMCLIKTAFQVRGT